MIPAGRKSKVSSQFQQVELQKLAVLNVSIEIETGSPRQ